MSNPDIDLTIFNAPSDLQNVDFLILEKNEIDGLEACKYLADIDRHSVINSLCDAINDFEKAILIEAGIYEYTILYTTNNNLSMYLMQSVYENKSQDIIRSLDNKFTEFSQYCFDSIKQNTINPQELAHLYGHEIFPEKWRDIINKEIIKEMKKKNIEYTDMYKCYKCGEKKCKITESQTRSADEPTTLFITCMVCQNTFKK